MKFELGEVVVTNGIEEKMIQDQDFADFVNKSLYRYTDGDWGNLDKLDRKSNDEALVEHQRLFGSYDYKGETVWFITEWDRSVTTILFPQEY